MDLQFNTDSKPLMYIDLFQYSCSLDFIKNEGCLWGPPSLLSNGYWGLLFWG